MKGKHRQQKELLTFVSYLHFIIIIIIIQRPLNDDGKNKIKKK